MALEGLLDHGELNVLALFDKPDPLDGPFFEETIYVTPSRLPQNAQDAIAQCTADSARALGLAEGPVHAELRINDRGRRGWSRWRDDRSAGCVRKRCASRRAAMSRWKRLIVRQAVGLDIDSLEREEQIGRRDDDPDS